VVEAVAPWVPTARDARPLTDEILRIRKERRLGTDLPGHHPLPQEAILQNRFKALGINVDDYLMHMSELEHRDLHGRGVDWHDWNPQWERFLNANPNATREQVFDFANKLLKERGLNRGVFDYFR
jgi:Predicted lipoprotein of unknown function (DUF2380)